MFEVYIYFDPSIQCNYSILSKKYQHLPIYVGKGNIKQKRKFKHLKNKKTRLGHKINKLIKQGIEPLIETIYVTDNESEALLIESQLIEQIGRDDLKTGPLYNLTGGGEGTSGILFTEERRSKHRKNVIKYFSSMTDQQRKEHGQKSLKNRTLNGVKEGAEKQKITKSKWSADKKAKIEHKRRQKWEKSYYNKTADEKKLTSQKCKHASLKRHMYFITYYENNIKKSGFLKDIIDSGYARDGIMYRISGKVDLHKPFKSRTTGNTISIVGYEKRKYLTS